MKQTIEYYYSLNIDTLYLENDKYHFVDNGYDYYFVYCNRTEKELSDIIECSRELKAKNIACHDIIANNKGEVITSIDEVNYLLLRVKNKDQEYIITDMIEFNKKLKLSVAKSDLYRNNWSQLWSAKVDYIEEQLRELKTDSFIKKTINYYIGLAENAIYYVNSVSEKYLVSEADNIVLSRKRVVYPNFKLNYLNPLNFIFDLEVRDIAEYLKSVFFSGEDALLELKTYLKIVKLTPYSYNMFFARLLYPSYYFDVYDAVINKNENVDELVEIVKKTNDYESFLKKAYTEISVYADLEKVSWLIY